MNRVNRGKRFYILIPILLAFVAPAFVKNEYYIHILIRVFLNILAASGLYVIFTNGLVSFAHAALMAIGGYTSALIVMMLGVNSWLALILALIVVMTLAMIFGSILLRLKGTYFFMASYAFGELVLLIFMRTEHPFGGSGGLMNIPLPDPIVIRGLFNIEFGSKVSFYYLALVFLLVPMWIVYRFEKGRMGRIWSSIKQADQLAQSVGINIKTYKIIAFVIGSCMAGLVGVFMGQYSSHLNPEQFNVSQLLNYLAFVLVGGGTSLWGPIIGATLLTLLSEFLSLYQFLALYQVIIFGIMIILAILFLPEGLVNLPKKVSNWYQQHKGT